MAAVFTEEQRSHLEKLARLGSGERFKALTKKLAGRPGVSDPAALAAAIGRKKYGAKKFAALGKK